MYSFKAFILLITVVASVNALITPLVVRHAHHRAVAARIPATEPVDLSVPSIAKRQNGNNRRCKPRPSTSSPPPPPPSTSTPRPTSTPPPPPPTSTRAVSTPTPTPSKPANLGVNLPSFMVGTQSGEATFYDTGLGACGITNKDTDFIAAVSHLLFDNYPGYGRTNPNNNPMCGRTVTVNYRGNSIVVALTDRCEACAVTDLDFSPAAFAALTNGNFGIGRATGMTWTWN